MAPSLRGQCALKMQPRPAAFAPFAEAAPSQQYESRASENRPSENRPIVSLADLKLSDRQQDVLALMMQGNSNKVICRTLNLAEPTVKNHVSAILKALNVTTRTEAVIAVGELGWHLKLPRIGKGAANPP